MILRDLLIVVVVNGGLLLKSLLCIDDFCLVTFDTVDG